MGLTELKKHWEELLAGEGMPTNIDQIGTQAKIHNGRRVPVVKFSEEMTPRLPIWPDQGTTADLAASSDPTGDSAEASLDRISPEE